MDAVLFMKVRKALTYEDYLEKIKKKLEIDAKDEEERRQSDLIRLNLHRSLRIAKTYVPDENTVSLIKNVSFPQIWMVLTEDWCGDSAQNIPYIAVLAALNEIIDFRLIERDSNPDIMDLYLTDGKSRSIPKLVAFDESGNEKFIWGPRPEKAAELVRLWKAEGKRKEEVQENLHSWYAKDKGRELLLELSRLITGSV